MHKHDMETHGTHPACRSATCPPPAAAPPSVNTLCDAEAYLDCSELAGLTKVRTSHLLCVCTLGGRAR